MNEWFEVDRNGLRQLQAGKPKTFVIRELVQNCWDENIKECDINIEHNNGRIKIIVKDDSPEGFKNLRDSYTLFAPTYKRADPTKRGRFNIGEKQVFSVCDKIKLTTTKGTVIFDDGGRHHSEEKTSKGTIIILELKGTGKYTDELVEYARLLIIPKGIIYKVNGEKIKYGEPHKIFEAKLQTEIDDEDNILKRTIRKTEVRLYRDEQPKLYEIGLPVTDIDCEFSVNVQQKVPLGMDRETISQSFLKSLYAEVLNNTYDDADCSSEWTNIAMSDDRISKDAVEAIIKGRFGDKICSENPFDPNSVDEAISHGYNIIRGRELPRSIWGKLRDFGLIQSSSELFGTNFTNARIIEPNENQRIVMEYAKRIAKRLLGIDIIVDFVDGGQNMVAAQFGDNKLTFNVSRLGNGFFENHLETTGLILHELGHFAGHHTESSYHELITKMAGELVQLALDEPKFFSNGVVA